MIKQVYDNRVDEILDNLKNRIIKEQFAFLNNQSKGREENKVIIKYLENFLREVNNGIY